LFIDDIIDLIVEIERNQLPRIDGWFHGEDD
jgi:hypothetical protein